MQLMVRTILVLAGLCMMPGLKAQDIVFPENFKKTRIANMPSGDSITYYQCHVDQGSQELTTSSGQKISVKAKKFTVTEKFVIIRNGNVYTLRYFVSGVSEYPNKKFAYLTLKEANTWGFELKKTGTLTEKDVLVLSAFESQTHDITYYELKVNSNTSNEAVIVYKKERTQNVVEGGHILSKNLSLLKN